MHERIRVTGFIANGSAPAYFPIYSGAEPNTGEKVAEVFMGRGKDSSDFAEQLCAAYNNHAALTAERDELRALLVDLLATSEVADKGLPRGIYHEGWGNWADSMGRARAILAKYKDQQQQGGGPVRDNGLAVGDRVKLPSGNVGTIREITPEGFAKGVTDDYGTTFHLHTGNIRLATPREIQAAERKARKLGL